MLRAWFNDFLRKMTPNLKIACQIMVSFFEEKNDQSATGILV